MRTMSNTKFTCFHTAWQLIGSWHLCQCVCVPSCIDVKLLYCAGGQQPIFLCCPTKLRKMWWMGSWTHEPVPAIYIYNIYIYVVPPLGAFKSQLGGTYILSLLFYTVNAYCDYTSLSIYIYIYIYLYLLLLFILRVFYCWCFCTSDAFHIRIRNDCSEQVCDSCWIRHGGMNSSGNACLSKVWMQRPDVWIYTF